MNRTPILFSSFIFMLCSVFMTAQEDDSNLITNGGFEETLSDKCKKLGQFSLVTGWSAATEEKADLFTKLSEYPDVGAPDNALGRSNPKEGDNYAGLLLYNVASKDGRMYITSELKTLLKKGQKYCLSYSISLADASKFATNNLGFYFSKKPEFEAKNILIRDNAIYPMRNKVQPNMESWEDICIVFTGLGTEKFITIGNFAQSSVTVTERMDVPKGSKVDQQQFGYYYLDALSLLPVARDSECNCTDKSEPEGPRIIFSKAAAMKTSASSKDLIEASTVYFYSNEDELAAPTLKDLDGLVSLMEARKELKIKIMGHMDSFEAEKGKEYDAFMDLSKMRAEKVKEYLVKKGIANSRLTLESFKASQPSSEMKTPLSLAKNRRVQFSIR